jgi:8-oxo-dGTP diphosphatase
MSLPYKIAVLCYLEDEAGCLLMLHRSRTPNAGMYSPVGGKLETTVGESPQMCAVREIQEETGVDLLESDLKLMGILSETGYEGSAHWLIFLFRATRAIAHKEIAAMEMDEGTLHWIDRASIGDLDLPETDGTVLWPLVQKNWDGFFTVHIDCTSDPIQWTVHEEA